MRIRTAVLVAEDRSPRAPRKRLLPRIQSMTGSFALLELAGYVGLLLWGTHMVTSGVQRGFGSELRHWLGRNFQQRWRAFLVGLGMTALLQSSTATGLMATSFTVAGLIGLGSGLAVMLGANVGT